MFYEAPSDYRGGGERATQSPLETIKELHDLKREHPGKTSFSDEITDAYINKKKRRGQIGGALIGGALGTGAGAVLGSRLIPNKGIRMATGGILGAGLGGYAGGRIERGRAHENVLHASNTQRKAVADLLSRLATAEGKSYTVSNADGSKSMRFNPQQEKKAFVSHGGGGVTIGHKYSPISLYGGHSNLLGVFPFPDAGIRVGDDDIGLTVSPYNIGIDRGAMGRGTNIYNSGVYGSTVRAPLLSVPRNAPDETALRIRDGLVGAGLMGGLVYSGSKGSPDRIPMSLTAAGLGAASGLGLGLGLRGGVKIKKEPKEQEKKAMFYEVLMEKKAQQKDKKKLSIKQKLGIGGAGLVGLGGGVGLAHDALLPHFNRRRMSLLSDNLKQRADAFKTGLTGQKLIDRLNSLDNTFNEGLDHISNVHDRYKVGGGLLLGGGLAYGAKKLMDRHNQRKD